MLPCSKCVSNYFSVSGTILIYTAFVSYLTGDPMLQNIIIRPAIEADTKSMVKVNVDTLQATYANFYPANLLAARNYEAVEAAWRQHLWESPETEEYAFVAETEEREIVGVLICGPTVGGEEAYQGEIFALFVLPAYHGQGIGKKLVQHAVIKFLALNISNMLVWVQEKNPARGFYEAIGGIPKRQKVVKRQNMKMVEIGYSWDNISQVHQLNR